MFDFFKVQKVTKEVEKIKEADDFEKIGTISDYFKRETGIDFSSQLTILESKITTLCKHNKISSCKEFLNRLDENNAFKQEAINYLTTNESFFYREFHQIAELVEKVKSHYSPVTILCAPCANGEEPYSIAIALFEAGIEADMFHITGIDISSNAINRSRDALYGQISVRNLSQEIIEKYFHKEGEHYRLSDRVKNQVKFEVVNIFDKKFETLGKFDYIFSRNMLIYFDYETRRKAHAIFIERLKNPQENIFFGHADLPNI